MKQNKPKYKKIIEAAVDVIAENGYHQAQVSRIAKHAGVADGTIYLYFKNKEDILISLFQVKMGILVEKVQKAIEGKTDAEEKLLALTSVHFYLLSEDVNLAVVTQLELRQSSKSLRLKINEVLKDYLQVIDSILEEGMAAGTFDPELDVRLARQMIFGTLDETATNWVMNDHKYNLAALAAPVHRLLVNGLSNQS